MQEGKHHFNRKNLKEKLISLHAIDEELRHIEIFKDYYITPTGKVYSKYNGDLYYLMSTRILSGYEYVTMQLPNGSAKNRRVHRLVAQAYIPNPNNYPIVGHKDNVKTNNCVENLYWTTSAENIQKAVDDGLLVNAKGYEDSQSFPIIVYDLNMKELDRCGSARLCSRKYGVSVSTVLRHCQGEIKTKPRKGYIFKFDERLNEK